MIIRKIQPRQEKLIKRVAAYVRVSTDKEEQEESYETQYEVYSKLINETENWQFAGIYADKGKSGTVAKHRPGFMQMIADAEARKLDIILVKSISRFARNVGESQRFVDILRSCDVTVIFEKENIRTDEPTSNFALALLSATAQDESHSISENRKWAYQQQYAEGKFNMGNNRILGYDTDKDGTLVPNGDAWIIREIFKRFIAGETYSGIVRDMNEIGAKTLRGGDFSVEAVRYIIGNETYVGDKHLMKRPPKDYLTHKVNWKAEYKDYYLTDDHEGIISREEWDKAQALRESLQDRLKAGVIGGLDHHFLYGKVFCGSCGSPFLRRTLPAGNGEYYKAWNCRERQKGKKGNGCRCRVVKEKELLEDIRTSAGWEQFSEGRFLSEVNRVIIFQKEIEVQRIRCRNRPGEPERFATSGTDVGTQGL